MRITNTSLPEVKLIESPIYSDDRGWFAESWNEQRLADAGLDITFRQDNHSLSRKDVLRGLHYQIEMPQGKLVRVISGRIYDVAVDIRRDSPTFGKWVGAELSSPAECGSLRMLWMPEGFAHGFLTLSEVAEVLYKSTNVYHKPGERTIAWDDADIAIRWPLDGCKPILSSKDAEGSPLLVAELSHHGYAGAIRA